MVKFTLTLVLLSSFVHANELQCRRDAKAAARKLYQDCISQNSDLGEIKTPVELQIKSIKVDKASIESEKEQLSSVKRERNIKELLSDKNVRILIMGRSQEAYSGNCPCPFYTDSAGRSCGRRSAYSRPGGYSPKCYETDVTNQEVIAFRTDFFRKYEGSEDAYNK